jgi:hypothetical protein
MLDPSFADRLDAAMAELCAAFEGESHRLQAIRRHDGKGLGNSHPGGAPS